MSLISCPLLPAPEETGQVSLMQRAAPHPHPHPHPPFIHSVSIILISQRRCRANKRYPMMQCGCQRRGASRGGSAFLHRERRREAAGEVALRREDRETGQAVKSELLKESDLHFYSLKKSGLIITSSGANNNLSKDHF